MRNFNKKHLLTLLLVGLIATLLFSTMAVAAPMGWGPGFKVTSMGMWNDSEVFGANGFGNGMGRGFGRGFASGSGGCGAGSVGPATSMLTIISEVLGMAPADVQAAHREGKSFTAIAEEKGVAKAELVAAIVENASQYLQQLVEQDQMTAAQMDDAIAALEARLDFMLDQAMVPGQGRGFRSGGCGVAPANGSNATQTSRF
ncbi:MAG: hypothetical protein SCK28_10080 [Bacillota bacterium]|nr:hypothetical protein [Bacillota bacterium]